MKHITLLSWMFRAIQHVLVDLKRIVISWILKRSYSFISIVLKWLLSTWFLNYVPTDIFFLFLIAYHMISFCSCISVFCWILFLTHLLFKSMRGDCCWDCCLLDNILFHYWLLIWDISIHLSLYSCMCC